MFSKQNLFKMVVSAFMLAILIPGLGLFATFTPPEKASAQSGYTCPCSIWPDPVIPTYPYYTDPNPIEVGLKFRTLTAGTVTGVRFFKALDSTGTHIGRLWTIGGTKLAEVTFSGETASGWQSADFPVPVPILPDTTYIISYYSGTDGNHRVSISQNFFTSLGVTNGPLHALANGEDGPNGVFSDTGGFFNQANASSNYWVDLTFSDVPDTTPPTVSSVSPAAGGSNVLASTNVTATFSEVMASATITGDSFELRDSSNNLVPASVTYIASTHTAVLDPTSNLNFSTTYTAKVVGVSGVTDYFGNFLAADYTWSFTTEATDTTLPTVSSVFPLNGATGVGLTTNVSATFSEAIDPSTVNPFTFELRDQANNLVPGTVSYDTGTYSAHLDPASDFLRGMLLTARLKGGSTGLKDLAGNALASDTVWTFSTPPLPTVTSVKPINGVTGLRLATYVSVYFNQAMDPTTITVSTFELRDAGNALVTATVTYNSADNSAVLAPVADLAYGITYTATIKGGISGVKDNLGTALAADYTWTFSTVAQRPSVDLAPGGPILVITSSANLYTRYFSEILKTEGLNEFDLADLSTLTAGILSTHDVVILGDLVLTADQVNMLTIWVNGGGHLIAMRPDKQLGGLLGLTDAASTLSNAYLLIDTAHSPGTGIVGQTLQFHGSADLYTLSGATSLAMLYSNRDTTTSYPAVTLRSVGSNGGLAAAFTFDLARSIVYTHQGNPAWQNNHVNTYQGYGTALDLFSDATTPWIDFNRITIPQADEQQRFLANLIQYMNADKKPLPRFWYFPKGVKAAIVLTGDDHWGRSTPAGSSQVFFERHISQSPANCSVLDWECIRSSSYGYPGALLTDAQAAAYNALGFEFGVHADAGLASGMGWCGTWPSDMPAQYQAQYDAVFSKYASLPVQSSERSHCYSWFGYTGAAGWNAYTSTPGVEANIGIRFDTNISYNPAGWATTNPGYQMGSGMMMRFAQVENTGNMTALLDIYNAGTEMNDDNGQGAAVMRNIVDAFLDAANGPQGYYGGFVVNMHSDNWYGWSYDGSDQIVASAKAHNIPVVSGSQMSDWLDGRNSSSFNTITWDGTTMHFSVTVGTGARNLQAMLPTRVGIVPLSGITRDGTPITFTTQTIKGVDYAFFNATAGSYAATYTPDTTPPVISAVAANPTTGQTATITWTTNDPGTSRVDFGTNPDTLSLSANNSSLVTAHTINLTGLTPNTLFYYRVSSTDESGNTATSPASENTPATFTTPSASLIDTTLADFSAGLLDANLYLSLMDNGEVMLKPATGNEFTGSSFPSDWTKVGSGTGTFSVNNGSLSVDGVNVGTTAFYSSGRSLEAVATFGGAVFQHLGFGVELSGNSGDAWAIISTGASGTGLMARTWNGTGAYSTETVTAIPGSNFGAPHRFRIDWGANSINYYMDGVNVATHALSISTQMRPMVSDSVVGGATVSLDWLHLSPYAASGTFISRVFDMMGSVTSGNISWNADTPAGTGFVLSLRTGNTPIPDGSWTGFSAVSNGAALGSDFRYLRYKVDFSSDTNQALTPTLRDVSILYNRTPDSTPPTITGRTPAPDSTAVALDTAVTATFNEPLDPATVTATSFRLRQVGGTSDVPATVSFAGLTATLRPSTPLLPSQQYQVTTDASVADLSGNPLGLSDSWTFTTAAQPWLDPAWQYRRAVAVSCPCSQDAGEYQVQIVLTSANFNFANANGNGSDLRVTAADGLTLLPFWIESWNTGQASVWVKLPYLPLAGTSVYLYYGNASPPASQVTLAPVGPFTKAAGNPILPSGAGSNTSLLAEDIVYDSVTGHYWMTLANYSASRISLVWSDNPTSPSSWTWYGDVISTFSTFSSGAPHLIKEGNLWYLFYADRPNIKVATASSVGGPYSTGSVVLSPSETWETYRVDEPYIFHRSDGKWVMIYMGDTGSVTEQVGYATANAVAGPYTKYAANPVLRYGPSGSFDAGTIADPWVVELNGVSYIGYTVSSSKLSPWQTAYATTTDWVTFVKHNVILPLSSSGWDASNTFRGAVTRINDTYVFSYTGDGFQMGLATQPVYAPVNNEASVFPFFDEFNGTSFDTSKWRFDSGDAGMLSETGGGTLTLTASSAYPKINGQTNFGMGYLVETRARHPQAGTSGQIAEFGWSGMSPSSFTETARFADDFHNTTVWEYQSHTFVTVDDPWTNSLFPIDNQTNHTFRVYRLSPTTTGFQVDNSTPETITTNMSTASISPFLMSFGSGSQLVVDWIRVRKFCGADAVATVGTEETREPAGRISIQKTGDAQVLGGTTVNFTITVTNNGDFDLSGVAVSDAITPACVRSIGDLAVGAQTSYACSLPNASADFTNTASATGVTAGGVNVSATASFFVDVIHPGITVSLQPASQEVFPGTTATFSVVVTNSGDTSLSGVAVSDPLLADCGRTIGALGSNANSTYTCSLANVTSAFTHTITASGQPLVGGVIQASAIASVTPVDLIRKPWLDTAWRSRQAVRLVNNCTQACTNYPVPILLSSSGTPPFTFAQAAASGADLRVTALDGTTQLPFWIESWDSVAGQAKIWVQMPSIPLSGTAIFLYYNNPAATSTAAQPEAIFSFFDGFNGSSLDPAKWRTPFIEGTGVSFSTTVSGGSLSLSVSGPGATSIITLLSQANYAIGQGLLMEASASHPYADGTGNTAAELGFATQNRTEMIRIMDYNTPAFLSSTTSGGSTTNSMARALSTATLLHRINRTTTNQARFAFESDAWETISTNVPTSSLPVWFMVYSVPGHPGQLNVDWIRVRSYCGVDTGVILQPVQNLTTSTSSLQAGWNLLSFNVIPVSTKIEDVLASIAGHFDLVYAWDASSAHSGTGNWMMYDDVPQTIDTLNNLDETMGFWIHMTVEVPLVITGSAPTSTNITLANAAGGWNLVGFPAIGAKDLPDVFGTGNPLGVSMVYAYHANDSSDPWKMYDPGVPAWVNDLAALTPGWGYWIKATGDGIWTVTNP